jgi:hypothetical protein
MIGVDPERRIRELVQQGEDRRKREHAEDVAVLKADDARYGRRNRSKQDGTGTASA